MQNASMWNVFHSGYKLFVKGIEIMTLKIGASLNVPSKLFGWHIKGFSSRIKGASVVSKI
jgi:hypothetical protein